MKGNLVAAMGGGGFFMMINGKVHFVDPLRGRFGPTRLPYKNLHEVIACKRAAVSRNLSMIHHLTITF